MSRRFLLLIIISALLSLCLASPGFAQNKGKGSKRSCKPGTVLQDPIPVVITFRESSTDKITDDFVPGVMPYDADANAVINCWGWIFMSSSFPEPGPRKIKLDFSNNGPEPDFGDVVVVTFSFGASISAADCGGTSNALDITTGEQCPARGNVSFDDPLGGKWDYAVRFNSNEGSTDVLVSRIDSETWTVQATDGHNANLVQYVKNKTIFTGNYVMPFLATIKCANADCEP